MTEHGHTKFYVKFLYPGAFVGESSTVEVEVQDKYDVLKMSQVKGAYGFSFFQREVIVRDGRELKSEPYNHSGIHFIDGEVHTIEEVEKWEEKEFGIMKLNMRGNEWHKIVKTNCGWYLPFDEEDEVIESG